MSMKMTRHLLTTHSLIRKEGRFRHNTSTKYTFPKFKDRWAIQRRMDLASPIDLCQTNSRRSLKTLRRRCDCQRGWPTTPRIVSHWKV